MFKMINWRILLISILVLFLFSCQNKIGYGVVLWSTDEDLYSSGSLVTVISESRINKSYLVKLAEKNEKIELPLWRVRFFEKQDEAQAYSLDYKEWTSYYALNQKSALPMRSEPVNQGNNTVYKLQDGQELKVIGRQAEKVEIAGLEGYWYQLLTDDGVEGWCFDYYLQVYTLGSENQMVIENEKTSVDPLLEAILSGTYYSVLFEDMINQKRVNLQLMNPDYYFKIMTDQKKIRIKTQDYELISSYESIANTAYHTYNFIGTSFKVEAYSPERLSVQFNVGGSEHKEGMVILASDIEEIRASELERRNQLAIDFIGENIIFNSDTYGEVKFSQGNQFYWENKSILISRNLISSKAGNQGYFSFHLFMDSSLRNKYDGVISFRFNNEETLNFLYQWKAQGVLLIYVPESHIKKGVIESDSIMNPLQIFFQKNILDTEEE